MLIQDPLRYVVGKKDGGATGASILLFKNELRQIFGIQPNFRRLSLEKFETVKPISDERDHRLLLSE